MAMSHCWITVRASGGAMIGVFGSSIICGFPPVSVVAMVDAIRVKVPRKRVVVSRISSSPSVARFAGSKIPYKFPTLPCRIGHLEIILSRREGQRGETISQKT